MSWCIVPLKRHSELRREFVPNSKGRKKRPAPQPGDTLEPHYRYQVAVPYHYS